MKGKLNMAGFLMLALLAVSGQAKAQEPLDYYWPEVPEFCTSQPVMAFPDDEPHCREDGLAYAVYVCETGLPVPNHIRFFDWIMGTCELPESPATLYVPLVTVQLTTIGPPPIP